MPESFAPFVTTSAKPRENGFVPFNLKGAVAKTSDVPAKDSPAPVHSPETCANPSVSLQRTGDVVTSIRVQCGCGQVVELACVY
jgi:hypothetical protein